MSGVSLPPGYTFEGAASETVARHIAATRGLEHERRIWRLFSVAGGWCVAGLMTCVAVASLTIVLNRPMPRDVLHVALVHDDGSYDPPRARDDLSFGQRARLFNYTVVQYVQARENYSYEGINANFQRASAMSAPEEAARYKKTILDKKSPDNPALLYGDGLNAGTANVTSIQLRPDPASPNAIDAAFVLEVTLPNQPKRSLRKTARLAWMDASDRIPIAVQQQYDPAGIAFLSYASTIDPDLMQ